MNTVVETAMQPMMAGYIRAAVTWLRVSSWCDRYSAMRFRMWLKLPESSLARIMLTYSVLKTRGWAATASLNGLPTEIFEDAAAREEIISDTGELIWSGVAERRGLVQVDTARSQALVGFARDEAKTTRNLALRTTTPFCALTLSSLDDQPIAGASRLLLTATAQVANTGMRWNAARKSLEDWGTPPARIEVVRGTAVLKALEPATAVRAEPLDGAGHVLGPAHELRQSEAGWELPLGTPPTTWYLITIVR